MIHKALLLVFISASQWERSWSCTNIIVSSAASTEGGVLIGDNDDTAKRFGAVTHFAAAIWPEGSTRSIYDFETSVSKGEIPQPPKTLNVMGGSNELGVVIVESTCGGISELQADNENKILDYGSLITTTLQRATSARDAISIIVNLTDTYGYTSTLEAFRYSFVLLLLFLLIVILI